MKTRILCSFAIALAVLVGFTACAHSDAVITTEVKAKLAVDPAVRASQFQVQTENQVVTLTANVDSQEEKDRALEIARKTGGVTDVVDMISVRTSEASGDAPEPGRMLGTAIDDAAITASVKARLLGDPLVKGLRIDVDTRESVVFLTGSVSSNAERDRAVELARTTEHVRDVKPNLVVKVG